MASVDHDSRLVQNGEMIATVVEGDIVLFSLRAGAYFGLNRPGTQIWNMLGESRNVGQILDSLALAYGVDRDELKRDINVDCPSGAAILNLRSRLYIEFNVAFSVASNLVNREIWFAFPNCTIFQFAANR